jgi:N-acylglucosamine 2-epimerase
MDFHGLRDFYEHHLARRVMPFWTEHCIDREHGGLNNCVGDDGTVQSADKVMWSQGRAIWTFSALYNEFDGDPAWLRYARPIVEFALRHGRDEDGAWVFRLHRDGSVAEPATSVYVDAFMIYGFTEYARALGPKSPQSEEPLRAAVEAYERTSPLLDDHSGLPAEPHPIPEGLQSHGASMIFALVYHELGLLLAREDILSRALELAERVMTQHLKPERELLYELVRPGGEIDDSDAGQTFVPGHVVESMWFMERIYRHHGRRERIELAMEAIRWHLEKGWDQEHGGLYLACHAGGGEPAWHRPRCKCWWPHTEALYALLRAYEVTGEQWCLDWYRRVHDYAFDLFPDREHGEWHQYFDRRGRPIPVAIKTLQVKDPFHLPRALVYGADALRRLAARQA